MIGNKILILSVITAQLIIMFLIGCFYLGIEVHIAGLLGAILGYVIAYASVKFNVIGIRNGL